MVGLDLCAVPSGQLRLVVKGVHMRNPARHEQEDDVLRLGREMGVAARASGSPASASNCCTTPGNSSVPGTAERRNARRVSREATDERLMVSYSTYKNSLLASRTRARADHFSAGSPG